MRRFTVIGLVPCSPEELASRYLDSATATGNWPHPAEAPVDPTEPAWWECASDSSAEALCVHRVSSTELREHCPRCGSVSIHRFLPAKDGCVWCVESRGRRARRESWAHFVRRRRQERAGYEDIIDSAAGYYASHK